MRLFKIEYQNNPNQERTKFSIHTDLLRSGYFIFIEYFENNSFIVLTKTNYSLEDLRKIIEIIYKNQSRPYFKLISYQENEFLTF